MHRLSSVYLDDSRDGQVYTSSKVVDGECQWVS
jgi:hypothetical protein